MQHIKRMFELMNYPIWIKDKENNIVFVNKNFKKDFKMDDYLISIINKSNIESEGILNLNDNIYKHIVFPIDDTYNYIAGMLVDIVELKNVYQTKYEKNILKTVIDNIPELIFYKDKNLKYVGLNKECDKFYKERGVNHIIGKTDLELPIDKEFIQTCTNHDHIVLSTQKPLYIEEAIPSKDGNGYRTALTIKTPVINDDGSVWGLVGVVRDITEEKKLEKKLRYLSYTDVLTSLYNRAYFDEKINKLIEDKQFPIGVISGDVNGLKIVNDTLGHIEGDNLLKKISKILLKSCDDKGVVFRWGGDEFITILPNTSDKECVEFINRVNKLCSKEVDDNFKISIAQGYSLLKENDNIDDVLRKSENEAYKEKISNDKSIRNSMLDTLKKNLQIKNLETQEHTERVLKYSLEVGKALNLDDENMQKLLVVANLHDIGKIGIPEKILLKPGKLTDDEYEIMKTHSEKGYRLVLLLPELSHAARGILTHHERWDGNGYPLGLKGEAIPLISRIVSIADTFDAMTNNRVYSNKKSKEDAIKEIKRCSGTQFDPEIVKVFCNIIDRF